MFRINDFVYEILISLTRIKIFGHCCFVELRFMSDGYERNSLSFWKIKKKACLVYKQELHKYPNSRSLKGIEVLAKYRGLQNGLKYAEAFILVKEIKK